MAADKCEVFTKRLNQPLRCRNCRGRRAVCLGGNRSIMMFSYSIERFARGQVRPDRGEYLCFCALLFHFSPERSERQISRNVCLAIGGASRFSVQALTGEA